MFIKVVCFSWIGRLDAALPLQLKCRAFFFGRAAVVGSRVKYYQPWMTPREVTVKTRYLNPLAANRVDALSLVPNAIVIHEVKGVFFDTSDRRVGTAEPL